MENSSCLCSFVCSQEPSERNDPVSADRRTKRAAPPRLSCPHSSWSSLEPATSRVLIPLLDRDFDTTEAAIPWRYLTDAGHEVVFATEHAGVAACDPRLLAGLIFGQLGAEPDARAACRDMVATDAFQHPIGWADVVTQDYAGFLLPGGRAPGMRQ